MWVILIEPTQVNRLMLLLEETVIPEPKRFFTETIYLHYICMLINLNISGQTTRIEWETVLNSELGVSLLTNLSASVCHHYVSC